jgi:hypothetical protein
MIGSPEKGNPFLGLIVGITALTRTKGNALGAYWQLLHPNDRLLFTTIPILPSLSFSTAMSKIGIHTPSSDHEWLSTSTSSLPAHRRNTGDKI